MFYILGANTKTHVLGYMKTRVFTGAPNVLTFVSCSSFWGFPRTPNIGKTDTIPESKCSKKGAKPEMSLRRLETPQNRGFGGFWGSPGEVQKLPFRGSRAECVVGGHF